MLFASLAAADFRPFFLHGSAGEGPRSGSGIIKPSVHSSTFACCAVLGNHLKEWKTSSMAYVQLKLGSWSLFVKLSNLASMAAL